MFETTDSVEMHVSGLTVDPLTNAPILMLKNRRGDRVIPIWIGLVEASAIATELEDLDIGRPLTHDLLRSTIEVLGARVVRVEITDLKDSTFFANVMVEDSEVIHAIDARPSDAIALALRCEAPIYVSSRVLEKSKELDIDTAALSAAEGADQWAEILENLSPEDFGKYKM